MTVNGHDPLAAAIAQAKAKDAADQMLGNMLRQALNQPARLTRVTGPSLVTVVRDEGGGQVLLVAMVTGDRWDIPLDDGTARRVAFALASAGTPDDHPMRLVHEDGERAA